MQSGSLSSVVPVSGGVEVYRNLRRGVYVGCFVWNPFSFAMDTADTGLFALSSLLAHPPQYRPRFWLSIYTYFCSSSKDYVPFEEQICLSRSHLFHIINSQIRLVAHRLACPYFSGLIRHPDSTVAVKTTKRGGSWPPPRPRRTPTRPQEHRHQESPLQLALSAGGDSSAASST